jgi:hypothetical protein
LRHFAEGFAAFDIGLWRRFDRPAYQAVARDFYVIGMALTRQMEFFRVLNPELALPKPTPVEPQQLELELPGASADRREVTRDPASDRRVHAR